MAFNQIDLITKLRGELSDERTANAKLRIEQAYTQQQVIEAQREALDATISLDREKIMFRMKEQEMKSERKRMKNEIRRLIIELARIVEEEKWKKNRQSKLDDRDVEIAKLRHDLERTKKNYLNQINDLVEKNKKLEQQPCSQIFDNDHKAETSVRACKRCADDSRPNGILKPPNKKPHMDKHNDEEILKSSEDVGKSPLLENYSFESVATNSVTSENVSKNQQLGLSFNEPAIYRIDSDPDLDKHEVSPVETEIEQKNLKSSEDVQKSPPLESYSFESVATKGVAAESVAVKSVSTEPESQQLGSSWSELATDRIDSEPNLDEESGVKTEIATESETEVFQHSDVKSPPPQIYSLESVSTKSVVAESIAAKRVIREPEGQQLRSSLSELATDRIDSNTESDEETFKSSEDIRKSPPPQSEQSDSTNRNRMMGDCSEIFHIEDDGDIESDSDIEIIGSDSSITESDEESETEDDFLIPLSQYRKITTGKQSPKYNKKILTERCQNQDGAER